MSVGLRPDRQASLKWQGDFTLPRFRAKLANQFRLHPDVAPGYEELYRSDLGARTISLKDMEGGDFGQSFRSNASSPSLGGTFATQPGGMSLGGSSLTALNRSGSGVTLGDSGGSFGITRSSSVPTLGLRRMTAQPAAARLGVTVAMEKAKREGTSSLIPTSPMSPEQRKEYEKELASDAMSRRLWAAAHGSEIHIKEAIELKKEDPSIQLKSIEVPGMNRYMKQGAKLEWRNPDWDGATLLIKAVRTNSISLCEYLLALGGDATAQDNCGRGVFHWAAMEGNPAMMELLLIGNNYETQLQLPDSGGDTPLHLASFNGHLPIIRQLIRFKVDPMQPNALGYNSIDLAEARRMWHIAHYLTEAKNQEEDKLLEDNKFQVRGLVRPCNLGRANELRDIAALNPKPKPKAAAKKK